MTILAKDRFRQDRPGGISGAQEEHVVDPIRHALSSLSLAGNTA